MRVSAFWGVLLFAVCLFPVHSRAEEAAVRAMIDDYVKAFNAKSLETVIGFWSEDCVHIDREAGTRVEGRDAIQADIEASFEERPSAVLLGRIDEVRFVKPDVASVQGEVTVSIPSEDPTIAAFSTILTRQDGKWLIDSMEEIPVSAADSSFDALRKLDWLVGTWTDESDEASVSNVFRWSANNAFLIRSFLLESADGNLREGTQIIGWDPRSQEIRSWSFNSNGSFGDAIWSSNGDDWLIKSSQTLEDGQAAAGTFVLSRIDEDQMTLRLIGHEIEGEPQPSGKSVTVVRQSGEPLDAPSKSINP